MSLLHTSLCEGRLEMLLHSRRTCDPGYRHMALSTDSGTALGASSSLHGHAAFTDGKLEIISKLHQE